MSSASSKTRSNKSRAKGGKPIVDAAASHLGNLESPTAEKMNEDRSSSSRKRALDTLDNVIEQQESLGEERSDIMTRTTNSLENPIEYSSTSNSFVNNRMFAPSSLPFSSVGQQNFMNLLSMNLHNTFPHANPTAGMMMMESGIPLLQSLYAQQLQQVLFQQQQQQSEVKNGNVSYQSVMSPDLNSMPQSTKRVNDSDVSTMPNANETKKEPSPSCSMPLLSQRVDSNNKEKIVWTTEMVNSLIEQYAMHLQRNTEFRSPSSSLSAHGLLAGCDAGLAHRAWRIIAKTLGEMYETTITPKACKNKFVKLKSELSIMKWIDRELKNIAQSYEDRNVRINPRETPEWEMKRHELMQQDGKFKRFLEPNYQFPFLAKMIELLPEGFASSQPSGIKSSEISMGLTDDNSTGGIVSSAHLLCEEGHKDLIQQHAKIRSDIRSVITTFQENLNETISNIESLLSSEEDLFLSSKLSSDVNLIYRLAHFHTDSAINSATTKDYQQSPRFQALRLISSEERFKEFLDTYNDSKLLFQVFNRETDALEFLLFPDEHKIEYLRELIENEKRKVSFDSSSKS